MSTGQELERFVPRYAVVLGGDFDARWATIDGTLCRIDISGFTSLSERMAARGRIGAEELTEVLDTVFGSMLSLVRERGGALLKFGGDALLLLFEGDDHPVQAACAAVEMRAALRSAAEIPTSVGRLALRMSIGLHSGDVHLFRASGTHRELIVAGPQATKVTEMEETASAGQIVVSSAAKVLLPDGSATEKKGPGWLLRWRTSKAEPPGPHERAMGADVLSHVPRALRAHLTQSKADSEHRLATVAFVEFLGIDELLAERGGEGTLAALDDLVAAVTTIADEEGITFLGTDVDRDAVKIILVSGVPITLVDESGRVLRAARRIIDLDLPFALKVGVNRGDVFSGEIGTEHRSTYTVMGDTVNLAARLMAAAPPGSIYSTADSLDESRTLFETNELDPITVKGKAEPVHAFSVHTEIGGRTEQVARMLPFAGRDEESQRIRSAIASVGNGSGASILVHGPTGIGKSRLVEESLVDTNLPVVDVRAEPYGTTNPYRALRDPFRSLLGIERGSNDEMAKALVRALEADAPALIPFAPLLGDLAHVELPPTEATRAIDRRFRQARVVDVVVELLATLFAGPLVVVAEDVHWADAATLSLLERLRRESKIRPWLMVTTSRVAPAEPHDHDFGLEALEDSTVASLVNAATEASPLRPDDVAVIVERSGGNPLFVQELLKAVRETGDIESLPTSLDGVVGSQIDALEPLARRVLRYVSVLGRSFRTSVAVDLIKTQGIELSEATRATLSGFIDEDGPDGLQFRHALVRDVAYEGLSYRRRQDLHNRAGRLVLEDAGDAGEVVPDVLALHFFLGGDHPLAWKYCRIAGDRNMEEFANLEAATQYERAVEAGRLLASATDDERREVWIKLGDVRERSGQFESSLEAYRRATKLTGDDEVIRAEVLLKRARANERAGAYVTALGDTTRAAKLLIDRVEPSALGLLAHVMAFAAVIRQAQEKPRMALNVARQTAEIAERAEEEIALARAWRVMDYAHVMLGEPDRAVHSIEALDVYQRLGEHEEEARTLGNLGALAYWKGDWTQALEYYERGRVSSVRVGNMLDAAFTSANIGEVLINQGRYEEADEPLLDARRTLRASGFSEGVAFVDLLLGRMYGIRGSLSEAEDALKEAISEAEDLGLGGFRLEAAIHLADAQCRSGSPETALETLVVAESRAPEDYVDYFQPLLARVRGSILNSAGQSDEAVAVLEQGISLAGERGESFEHGLLVLTLRNVSEDRVPKTLRQEAQGALRSLGVRSAPGITISG